MPKNNQQDQKQARQKKNSTGAQAQGTQCRDGDLPQSSDPAVLNPVGCQYAASGFRFSAPLLVSFPSRSGLCSFRPASPPLSRKKGAVTPVTPLPSPE